MLIFNMCSASIFNQQCLTIKPHVSFINYTLQNYTQTYSKPSQRYYINILLISLLIQKQLASLAQLGEHLLQS